MSDDATVVFSDPDLPYLLLAALRQRRGDAVLGSAFVVPPSAGRSPEVLLGDGLAADPEVLALVAMLDGRIAHPETRS
jgi:hypothetical protein